MEISRLIFVWGLATTPLFYPNTTPGGFKLVKHDKVISLYERWIVGGQGEKIRELKAVFTVKSDVPSVLHLLKDQQKGPQWNSNVNDYKVFKSTNPDSWMAYIRYDIPWPLDDQDCLLNYRMVQDSGWRQPVEITFNSTLDNRFPISDDIDRVREVHGKWVMEDEGGGYLKITYLISSSHSKNLPRWITDRLIHDNLFSTMTAFKLMLEDHYT